MWGEDEGKQADIPCPFSPPPSKKKMKNGGRDVVSGGKKADLVGCLAVHSLEISQAAKSQLTPDPGMCPGGVSPV